MALELGAAQLVVGKLSAEQLAEYRRLAEATGQYIKDGHFTDPAGFREANSAFHLFPIEATGNADPARGLPQAAGAGVHGPGADPVGRRWSATSPRTTSRSSTRSSSGDFEAAARGSSPSTPTTPRRRCGPASKSRGARAEMIFPGRFDGKVLVVTGAAQGLGEAVATRAAREGGAVALVDRSELVHEVAEKLAARGRADHRAHLGPGAVPGRVDRDGRGPQPVRPDRHPDQQRRRHDLGQAVRRVHRGPRSRPRSGARCSRRCGAAGRCCRSWSSSGRGTIVNVSSVATRGHQPRARTRRPRAGSTRSPRRWPGSTPSTGSGSWPPRPAASRHRRGRCPAALRSAQTEQEKAWYQAHRRPDARRPR